MTEDKIKRAPFKFNDFLIEESHIIRTPSEKEVDLSVKIKPEGIIYSDKKLFQLQLSIIVEDVHDSFSAKIKAVGIFGFEDLVDSEHLDNYFYLNAPAILFPYVRSYISSLTALSGMKAINLPPMNMIPLGKELKENCKTIDLEKNE